MAEQAFASTAVHQQVESRFDKLAETVLAPEKPPEAAAPPQQEVAAPEAPEAPAEAAPEPEYANLEDYLTKSNLDRESFLSLPARVKVDGQESDVPLKDILKAYQLEQHVQAKSISLAEKQKAWEAEQTAAKALLKENLDRAEAVGKFAWQQALQEFQGINWDQLRATDPTTWAVRRSELNDRADAINRHLANIKAQQDQLAQDSEREREKATQAEYYKMLDARPEWRDDKVFKAARDEMTSYARNLGFTPAELGSIYDHRYMQVLHDAARYAALQAKAPEVAKRVRTAPKAATPGARITRDPKAVANQQAKERFMKNPRDQDAQAAYFDSLA